MDINKIVIGETYFNLMYEDEKLSIPVIKTLVFEKFAVRSGGEKCLIFKDLSNVDGIKFYIDEVHVDQLLLELDDLIFKLQAIAKASRK